MGKGFIPLQLPGDKLQPFTCNAGQDMVVRRESQMTRRTLVFRDPCVAHQLARFVVVPANGLSLLPAGRQFGKRIGMFVGGGVQPFLPEPLPCQAGGFLVQAVQCVRVASRQHFPVNPLLESLPILLRKKGCFPLGKLGGSESSLKAIKVASGDRIELVIMTAGAAQGMGEEHLTHTVGDVIQKSLAGDLRDLHARQLPGSHAEEPDSHPHLGGFRIELVAGDLLTDELIVGFVLIEGTDHVVPVSPCIAPREVVRKPGGVGVADDIQPVASPVFSIMRAGQETIDHLSKCLLVRYRVSDKRLDLLRCWRQTDEVVGDPTNERVPICHGCRLQGLFLESALDKCVDRIPGVKGFGRRHSRLLKWLIGPEILRKVATIRPLV